MRTRVCFIVLLILLTGNVLFWGSQKEGFHVDEMFSYEQVGNTEYPKPEYDRPGEPCMNCWHTRDYYLDYLTISSDEAFQVGSFYRSASMNSAHPPLYLTLLGICISAVSPDHFTKWSGLFINLVFYVLMLLTFYDLSRLVLKKEKLAFFCTFLIGICVGIVSIAVFIRVYMMLSFFTVAFMNLHVRMLNVLLEHSQVFKKRAPVYLCFVLLLILGALSHYYFFIYAFFVCMFFSLILLLGKEYRQTIEYVTAGIFGVLVYCLIWPNILRDLFSGQRGVEAIGNLTSLPDGYGTILAHCLQDADRRLLGGFGLLFLAAMILPFLIRFFRIHTPYYSLNSNGTFNFYYKISPKKTEIGEIKNITAGNEWIMLFLILSSSICSFLMIAKVAPVLLFDQYKDPRYFANLLPFFLLTTVFFVDRVFLLYFAKDSWKKYAWSILTLFVLSGYLTNGIDYLYKGADTQIQQLKDYANDKAIFITELPYLSSNLNVYFTQTEAVYPTTRKGLLTISDILAGQDNSEILLYISTDTENDYDVLQTINKQLDAKQCHFLFETVGRHTARLYVLEL